jgi:NADPH:quinone reductase-like Zn-dependent oxidoreductase
MKAIVRATYCLPDALELAEVDQPVPGANEVLVRVHAAGVDQSVWHVVTGLPYLVRLISGPRRPKNPVPGSDMAGRVAAVGANVTRFKPGDEVFGASEGAYAEYALAAQDTLAIKPANVTFEQAAAVPVSACAALHALRDAGKVTKGQNVLVIGASGGVGTYAVQLAKSFGARVTGVCRTAKTDLVASLGADRVIDYTREDFADGPDRYDLVIDTGGNRKLSTLRRALTPRGTLVIVGSEQGGGRWFQGTDRQLRALILSPFSGRTMRPLMSILRHDDLQTLARLLESGAITPPVDRAYPLEEVPEALNRLRRGEARGKLVITV